MGSKVEPWGTLRKRVRQWFVWQIKVVKPGEYLPRNPSEGVMFHSISQARGGGIAPALQAQVSSQVSLPGRWRCPLYPGQRVSAGGQGCGMCLNSPLPLPLPHRPPQPDLSPLLSLSFMFMPSSLSPTSSFSSHYVLDFVTKLKLSLTVS